MYICQNVNSDFVLGGEVLDDFSSQFYTYLFFS